MEGLFNVGDFVWHNVESFYSFKRSKHVQVQLAEGGGVQILENLHAFGIQA